MAHYAYGVSDELQNAIIFDNRGDVCRILADVRQLDDKNRLLSAFSYQFVTAIQMHNERMIRLLRSEGVYVTAVALEAAAYTGSLSLLKLLFELGWDIDKALGPYSPPVLRYVIPLIGGFTADSGRLTLYDHNLVSDLLDLGADLNAGCNIDLTPLSFAVKEADMPILRCLIQRAATSPSGLRRGQLMHFAVQRVFHAERAEVIRLLAETGAPLDKVQYQDKKSVLWRSHFKLGTPLYLACQLGDCDAAETLIALGANLDKRCMQYGKRVDDSPRKLIHRSRELACLLDK